MRLRVCIDFDGVVYPNTVYHGTDQLPESPVPGAVEGLELLARTHDLVLASCRLDTEPGWEAVRAYLDAHRLSWLDMERGKPLADVYLDDRAVCFDGDWNRAVEQIKRFAPWNELAKAMTRGSGRRPR